MNQLKDNKTFYVSEDFAHSIFDLIKRGDYKVVSYVGKETGKIKIMFALDQVAWMEPKIE